MAAGAAVRRGGLRKGLEDAHPTGILAATCPALSGMRQANAMQYSWMSTVT